MPYRLTMPLLSAHGAKRAPGGAPEYSEQVQCALSPMAAAVLIADADPLEARI
jgi:hypothetical protein